MDKNNVRANQHNSYGAFTALGLLLPIVGIIIGIVYLTKKDLLDRKVGEHTIVMSIIGFVLTFVIIGITGGSFSDKSSTTNSNGTTNTTQTQGVEKSKGKVEVKSEQLKTNYGWKTIVGEVINNTNKGASYVKVTATYYDIDGKVTGTSFTYAGDTPNTPLAVSATAPFEVTARDKDIVIDHYKLDVNWQ